MVKNKNIVRDYNREEFEEIVVKVGRVVKVVKGGRRFRFNALVVVGNRRGVIGIGTGKAKEVPDAIRKAVDDAFKNLVKIEGIKFGEHGSTINHDVIAKFKASKIVLKPASEGTGLIAGGAVRPVLELAGIKDILSKSLGSNNPHTLVRATLKALQMVKTKRYPAEEVEELSEESTINKNLETAESADFETSF